MRKVIVAGGSGFLGRALIGGLARAGYEPIPLTRHTVSELPKGVLWDGVSLGSWVNELEGAHAVVNLCGSPVAVKWTPESKAEILTSRVDPTRALGSALEQAKRAPAVWVNGSAVGYYGDRGDEPLSESSSKGSGFLADVCEAWEAACTQPTLPKTRRVLMRTGVVLGNGGGALEPLSRLTKAFLGGSVGDGKQWMPWIHVDDWVGLVLRSLEREWHGPINGCASNPVTNESLMAALRNSLHRPWSPPVPALGLKIARMFGGPEPQVLLDSCRAIPQVALSDGFQFKFPMIDAALLDLSKPVVK